MSRRIAVLKFGGSIINEISDLIEIRSEIERFTSEGTRVVAVVSAFNGVTDGLVKWAHAFTTNQSSPEYASLLATGEMDSAARLALVVQAGGIPTKLLSYHQLQLRTTGDPVDAEPVSVGYDDWDDVFSSHMVVVVPGFIGVDDRQEPTLLGRGGSDLTAVFLSHYLNAESCRLYKDVGAWYDSDPRTNPDARRYLDLSWKDAVANECPVVQPKTVAFARSAVQPFTLVGLGSSFVTRVGSPATVIEGSNRMRSGSSHRNNNSEAA